MQISFHARTEANCKQFLKLRMPSEAEYSTIDAFIENHPDITVVPPDDCMMLYRGNEYSYGEYTKECAQLFSNLPYPKSFISPLYLDKSLNASAFFVNKARECLGLGDFFLRRSKMVLENNYSIPWHQGYSAQFQFRCIYFGTAATWYQNCYDQILQVIYWSRELYRNLRDKKTKELIYQDTWTDEEILERCSYHFVNQEIKNEPDLHDALQTCTQETKTVRTWANYIKHKGGLKYAHLEAEMPFAIYVLPKDGEKTIAQCRVNRFSSPLTIDIDKEMEVLFHSRNVLCEFLNLVIASIPVEKQKVFK